MDNLRYDLLLEFDFVVDLDLAIYKYIRINFGNSDLINRELIELNDEKIVIAKLLARQHINPLTIIIPGMDTHEMYQQLLTDKYADILKYATAYDTFKLCITWLNSVTTPITITILCKNRLEQEFITKLNPRLKTIVVANKQNVAMAKYTSLYVKYLASLVLYENLNGKHIYFANAGFNSEEDGTRPQGDISYVFSLCNELHMMDLYTKVKYRFLKHPKDEEQRKELQ